MDKIFFKLRYKLYAIIKDVKEEKKQENIRKILEKIRCKGENFQLNGNIIITEPTMLSVGNNVHIGDGAFLYTDGGLVIGDNTHISNNVTINTIEYNHEGDAFYYDDKKIYKSVIIEKNVWIGLNVNITPGITIGEGAIIVMGAVITKDVPAYSIVENQSLQILKNRNIDIYNSLETEKNGAINGISVKENASRNAFDLGENIFFIVSTGRSGSEAISQILSQNKLIKCEHESKGILINLSTQYEHGEISKEEVKQKLIEIYSNLSNIDHKEYLHYGESDQKLSNLIEILHEIFPKAKFIWLLRNAKDVVTSTYSRGWFHDGEFNIPIRQDLNVSKITSEKIYSIYRLNGGKIKGAFTEQAWKEMSPFEKNCWYWVYWNKRIEQQLEKIEDKNFIKITLENLEEDIDKLNNFLGLNSFHYEIKTSNKAKYELNEWTENQKNIFEKICKPYQEKWHTALKK